MAEDIFKGFGKSISKAAQKAAGTTSSFFEASRIRAQVAGEQKEIGKLYQKIGEAVFRSFDGGEVKLGDSEKAAFEEIRAHMAAIVELKGVLASVKGMKVCPSCEELIDAEVAFCPKCGAPAPVPEAAEKTADAAEAAETAADAAAEKAECAAGAAAETAVDAAETAAEKAECAADAAVEKAVDAAEMAAEKAECAADAAAEKAECECAAETAVDAAETAAEKAADAAGTASEDAAVDAEFRQIEDTAEAAEDAVDAEFTPIPDNNKDA